MKISRKLFLSLVVLLLTFIISGLTEISYAGENFSIQKLQNQLKSNESQIRSKAAFELGKVGEPAKEFIPELIKLLNDEDKIVRINTLYTLVSIGGSEKISTSQLIELLKDPNKTVRSNTAFAVAEIGEPARKAIPDLIRLLEDPDQGVRSNSVLALGQMSETGQESIPKLVKILEDSNGSIRGNALAALKRLGGAEKVPSSQLIKLLNDSNRSVRGNAVDLLSDIKEPQKEVILKLIKLLKDPFRDVRSNAVFALGRICECGVGKEAIPELTRLLKDPYKDVRSNAASAVGNFGESAKEAIPQLLILLKEPNKKVYENAANTLGKMGKFRKEIIPQLIKLLEDSNPKTQSNAVYALGNMGESAIIIIPDLIKVLEKSDKEVSKESYFALMKISEKSREMKGYLSSSELDKAISGFEKALKLLSNDKDQYNKLNENLIALKDEQTYRSWNLVIGQFKKNPKLFFALLALLILPIAYYIVLYLSPLQLLLIPSGILGKYKVTSFLLKLKYHPKVLNAWVGKYLGSADTSVSTEKPGARILFWKNATANLHPPSSYIPIPLHIETGLHSKRCKEFPSELLQKTFSQNIARLLIYGEGGIGKTSLACKIAEFAMADAPAEQRLHKNHSLLPILIEPEQIEYELKFNKPMSIETTRQDGDSSYKTSNIVKNQPFIEAIRKQLQNLINEQSPINDELLKQLLQSGHVLIIVDRFSEMSEDARQTIDPVSETHPINALIVTSRKRETFSNIKMDVIEPLQLTGSELTEFMEAYFKREKNIPLKEQPSAHKACDNLENIVKSHGDRAIITALLAKLAAGQLLAEKPLPSSIPNLMIESLNLLNDQVDIRGHKFDNSTIRKSMQLIAWTCLQETFCPNAATLDKIVNAFENSGFNNESHSVLNYLVNELRVVERVGNEKKYVRIVHDPLAEYLAGLHLVEFYANKLSEWKKFLKRADEFENTKTQGFMLAVYDCCRVATSANIVSLFEEYICKIAE
jgi:HEAT repeat protein